MTELEDVTNQRTTCVKKVLFFPSYTHKDYKDRLLIDVYDVIARDKYSCQFTSGSTCNHLSLRGYNCKQKILPKMKTIMRIIVIALLVTQRICEGTLIDTATGIEFPGKLGSLSLFGVGVRKKGPIKVYSVGLYGTEVAKKSLSSISKSENKSGALFSLRSTVKSKLPAIFVLEMNFKVTGEKMATAIAESVAPRNIGGNAKEIDELKSLILSGVQSRAGSVNKGTKFQFDCMIDGLSVHVDGKNQGKVKSSTLSKAFCDVYLDDKSVSPSLRESCILNTCQP